MYLLLFCQQFLNGLQFGVMLFLMASGLTLIFGIMDLINLAHGSLFMVGAYLCATVFQQTGSFMLGLLVALPGTALVGIVVEIFTLRTLYARDHLDQVLATFGLILFFNELTKIIWGPRALFLDVPEALSGTIEIIPGAPYPTFRLAIIVVGIIVAIFLYFLITRTRLGMLIRASATNREIVGALGVNVKLLYTLIFGLGALLAGLAGAMAGPLFAVEVGMGEDILILTFVVIVIGGIGSIRGALVGAILVGLIDTLGRAFLPALFKLFLDPATADGVGASLDSMAIYILMAVVLAWKPRGLLPAHE
ncbi:MAG: branched-chain amino acid ABC transporter permease [Desulfobacteraceae bacterium]|jgi:branched-chain amino acid transport system permease protein|nr:branched-chain amino acid ABC transporter permease [Desulfobacteraceae bacterium]MDH3574459.1 branched-chain amino acid ABC transporter permease [Desulfobacteraceae bacterium]MDH3722303.1 branched-chain amino acid ABC transporter permease [Desulfobacteraceae bacterium]MDH3837276.1 branched-chain amino acid ABC transporter permease [Desulfobacteraceae bacterium]MDH3873185.1 branched-chain amino acid ABC transporter permease [Desulfobacteraceae bacterium]